MKPKWQKTRDARVLKGKFKPSTSAEREFFSALKRVAKIAGRIVNNHVDDNRVTISEPKEMQKALDAYAKKIEPWALKQSLKFVKRIGRSNRLAYQEKSKTIGKELKSQLAERNAGAVAAALVREQVGLIKSIPIEAGLRAQKIALNAVLSGTRAAPDKDTIDELKKQLGATTEVAISRAKLISITETARSNAAINEARALAVGAKGYIWHATMDEATRISHRKMNGKYVEYAKPPRLSDGTTGHAGTFPRCRCFGEPVFED